MTAGEAAFYAFRGVWRLAGRPGHREVQVIDSTAKAIASAPGEVRKVVSETVETVKSLEAGVSQVAQQIGKAAETQLPVLGDQVGAGIVTVRDQVIKPAVSEVKQIGKGISLDLRDARVWAQKGLARFRRQGQLPSGGGQ